MYYLAIHMFVPTLKCLHFHSESYGQLRPKQIEHRESKHELDVRMERELVAIVDFLVFNN